MTETAFRHGGGSVGGMTQAQPAALSGGGPSFGSRPHLPALDGLRGLAILGVLLFHTGHLAGGFLGVDLFFALSGYLITGLLLREAQESGRVSLLAFWGKRIRRLLPALATMLTVVTVLVWAVAPPDLVRTTLGDAPWVQANLVNWHLLAESAGYWDRFGQARVFEHLWSIAVEEQFYLLWPLLVLVIARSTRRVHAWALIAAVLISAASLALMVVLAGDPDPSRVYTGTDTRAFSLLLGAAAATAPVRAAVTRLPHRWAGAAAVLSAIGLGTSWLLVDETSPWLFTGGLFAHSLGSALLVALCAQRPGGTLARALGWWPLRRLGLISYSLYLWHWPVIVLLSEQRTGLDGGAWTLTVWLVSIVLATLSTHLVENPIRFHATWARGRSGMVAFAALMAGLVLLWWALPEPAPPAVDLTNLD